MEKTPKYDLSQWEKTDRILMEDFNADNANLEAALAALNTGKADVSALNSAKSALQTEDARLNSVKLEYKPIRTYSFTVQNATEHTLDLGALPLWDYYFAQLHVDVPEGAIVEMFLDLPSRCRVLPLGTDDYAQAVNLLTKTTYNDFLFFPMKRGEAFVTAHRIDNRYEIFQGSTNYRDFNQIVFRPWKTQTDFSGTFTLTFSGIQ